MTNTREACVEINYSIFVRIRLFKPNSDLLFIYTYTFFAGTNEIGSYLPDHRKDPTRDWGSYSTVYGGSYGYDTNYVGKFDVPKYYPKSNTKQLRPYENDQFYGEFYNYGGAFGYGDNYIPANQDSLYGGTGRTEECSVRAGAGFRLSRGVVRKTYLTPNLDQCESLCINEKSYACMSFSYRYILIIRISRKIAIQLSSVI